MPQASHKQDQRIPDQTQALAIALLCDADAMGGPVTRIDTHISSVFLAGDRARKLKRAIRLPFLDYGTAARRAAACAREVEINRRIAPELYLGVETIRRDEAGVHFGGAGALVDTVVVMRRFPAGALLSEQIAHAPLPAPLLRALAARIAAMHTNASPLPGDGGAAALARTLAGIAAALARVPGGPDWARAASNALDRHAALADARAAAGVVRACHGDLHLGNIALLDGEAIPFDAIEFNDAFTVIDPLYDFAFLVMDLLAHRDRAGATLVFNAYLDRRPDPEGLALFPLFLSLRAAIRAEVALIRHDDAAEAAAYLALAQGLLGPPSTIGGPRRLIGPPLIGPRLIAIGGFSGSGKSTLAQSLAPGLGQPPGARWLRTDTIRKREAGIAETEKLDAARYTQAASDAVYDMLYAEAAATLAAGHDVIADAVFAAPRERARIAAVAHAAGCRFSGIWLDTLPAIAEARLAARCGDASDATIAVHRAQILRGTGEINWTRLDGGRAAPCLAARARAALEM